MGMELFFDTMERLTPQLRAGDLAGCEAAAIAALQALPPSPFHVAADLAVANDPVDAARYFDGFYVKAARRRTVRAVYTELNGFDINPGRWFCDVFGYTTDGGLDDLDWLSDWQDESADDYTLTGLEPLQAVYAGPAFRDPVARDARLLSNVVVVTKFQRFVQRAAEHMTALRVPLYVTAHDYDFVARLVPGG